MQIVDLGKKFDLLLPTLSRATIKREIANKYFDGKLRTPNKWFGDVAAEDVSPLFIEAYAKSTDVIKKYMSGKKIEFLDIWFAMPIEEFERQIAEMDADKDPSHSFSPNYNMDKLAETLSGTYQIIRKFVDHTDKYVLEPLVVRFEKGNGARAFGYSRNEVKRDYLYQGSVITDEKLCFAMMERPHRSVNGRRVGRCMVMHASFAADAGLIDMEDAFSGLMLRGVKGVVTRQRGVSIPFIALKLSDSPVDLAEMGHGTIPEGKYVAIWNDLLVGELTSANPRLLEFCHSVFELLKYNSINVMQTLPAATVISAIRNVAGREVSCSEIWSHVVHSVDSVDAR